MSQADFPTKARAVKTSQDASFDLTGHFLLAMPAMADPTFNNSVIYLAEHNAKGALGIVVNQPLQLSVGQLFKRVDLNLDHDDRGSASVLAGGPVHNDRGFVLHRPHGAWSSSLVVTDAVALTSSKDILEAVANGAGPAEFLLALGYSGWGAGQLEDEISRNAWLTVPANEAILFEHASNARQGLAFGLLGIDRALISSQVGHA
jgi:putative transcriptional regulator